MLIVNGEKMISNQLATVWALAKHSNIQIECSNVSYKFNFVRILIRNAIHT